jgi:hypothetical protein
VNEMTEKYKGTCIGGPCDGKEIEAQASTVDIPVTTEWFPKPGDFGSFTYVWNGRNWVPKPDKKDMN